MDILMMMIETISPQHGSIEVTPHRAPREKSKTNAKETIGKQKRMGSSLD